MGHSRVFHALATLGMVLGASGHGDDEMAAHSGDSDAVHETPGTYPTTYLTLDSQQFAIRAHIALMVVSWFIILPIATMLSLAKCRYTQFVRLGFTATNIVGVFCGISYKNQTPDLYPGSVHSAVGWIATGITATQISHVLVGPMAKLFNRIAGRDEAKIGGYVLPPIRENFDDLQGHDDGPGLSRRKSFDVESLHVNMDDGDTSSDSPLYQEDLREAGFASGEGTFCEESDSDRALHHDSSVPPSSKPDLTRTQRIMLLIYNVMDRTILIVAFVAFCTGIVTFGGLFKGQAIFNGIAHWIKGGIFFWLGVLTLGRWCGCFAELGWAWNTRPGLSKRQSWLSSEFVESSLIFIYGSTNIFLEHLAGWGEAWTARDLQHVAITVLFIGGGLCGILVEYVRVKGLGEKKATQYMETMPVWSDGTAGDRTEPKLTDHRTKQKLNGISINPLPALVIFFMGGSMASHEQDSMVSTMVHKQWGNLLGAASVARLLTYMMMYLKPPTSTSPSHPPTELLMSFCLISGGILFMASSSDTVDGMIHLGIDVMALYTVTLGLTGILMAWVVALLALKGWASR